MAYVGGVVGPGNRLLVPDQRQGIAFVVQRDGVELLDDGLTEPRRYVLHMLLEGRKVAYQWWIKWRKQVNAGERHDCLRVSIFKRMPRCREKRITQRKSGSHAGWKKCRCQAEGCVMCCSVPLKSEALSYGEIDHALLLRLNDD